MTAQSKPPGNIVGGGPTINDPSSPTTGLQADEVARLASYVVSAPTGLVSLVGTDGIRVAGLFNGGKALRRSRNLSLSGSLCPIVVDTGVLLAVEDCAASSDHASLEAYLRFDMRAYLGVPLRDRKGTVIGAVAVCDTQARRWTTDDKWALTQITELVGVMDLSDMFDAVSPHSRTALQHAQFLTTVLDNLHSAIAACDADGNVVLVNRALRQAHHLDDNAPSIDIHKLRATLFHPDGTPMARHDAPLVQALRGHTVHDVELAIQAPDTPLRRFVADAEPIRNTDGDIDGAVVSLHDVTTHRRAQRFRTCEIRVTKALDNAGTVEQVSTLIAQTVADTLNWPHVELWLVDEFGTSLRAIGHWTAPHIAIDSFLQPVVKGVGITGTVWATGEPLWIPDIGAPDLTVAAQPPELAAACATAGLRTVAAVPIHDSTVVGVMTCFADTPEYDEDELLTHLRVIATRIGIFITHREADHLTAQLQRSRDDFLTLVGHELRTPLTSISSSTEILISDQDRLPADAVQMLHVINRNSAALTTIVDDLLDLSTLNSGYASITPEPIDLADILRGCLTDIAPAAHAGHVHIDASAPATLTTSADPARIRQAINNLLSNAVKYSLEGGTITVRLTTEHDDIAVLSVSDTGIGIPAEERTHLFRHFFRATNARHSTIPGTGLGLVATRTIINAHHGKITATHHDPGTTITVHLRTTPKISTIDGPGRPG